VISVIFIPVLFVCANGQCNFMQAQKHYVREAECRAQLDVQKKHMQELSLKAGQMVTLIEGTCITAKDGML
jgi:hypothetical protein